MTSSLTADPDFLDFLMGESLKEARKASETGEVPVGAVISHNGKIISSSHNLTETERKATGHAEILAINKASEKFGDWRLSNTILCVTLEPCTMCMGAIKLARIPMVVYGATDRNMGACGSLFDISQDARLGPVPRVVSAVREEECAGLLRDFFRDKREKGGRQKI